MLGFKDSETCFAWLFSFVIVCGIACGVTYEITRRVRDQKWEREMIFWGNGEYTENDSFIVKSHRGEL